MSHIFCIISLLLNSRKVPVGTNFGSSIKNLYSKHNIHTWFEISKISSFSQNTRFKFHKKLLTFFRCSRFQKHLEKVMDILQQAIQNLPEPMELDSKLLIETDLLMNQEKSDSADSSADPCYVLDRIMCNIVDNMQWFLFSVMVKLMWKTILLNIFFNTLTRLFNVRNIDWMNN